VFRAKKRLADRLQQEEAIKKRDDVKGLVDSIRDKINSPNQSQADLEKTKGELTAKRDLLLQELNRVNQEIATVDNNLSQIPSAIEKLKEEKQEQAHQAYQLHKSLQPILGSADDDNREIQEANEIHLRAMNVIQNSLGPL
jgi:chromosome segregation ATPase